MKYLKYLVCLCSIIGFNVFSDEVDSNCESCKKEDPIGVQISAQYAFGDFIGFKENYGSVGLFVTPSLINDLQMFTDLQGYYIGGDKWGGTVGVGARYWDSNKCRALGGNIYYDYREACVSSFSRLGIGLESLGEVWDFRFNSYLLVDGTVKKSHLHVYNFSSGFRETCLEKEHAYTSFDAEVGANILRKAGINFYNALGTYYYASKNDQFWGGYLRVQFNVLNYLTLEADVSYDKKYHTQVKGIAALTFPLYGFKLDSLCDCSKRILLQPVYRNPMITTKKCCKYTQNW